MVANDKIPPPYIWVHPAPWKINIKEIIYIVNSLWMVEYD
jgi:hypothetical protein